MSSSDTKTERVQLTLPRSLVNQCREIAEQSGLTLSKVLEHFARTGVQQGLTLTFSHSSRSVSLVSVSDGGKHSAPTQQRVNPHHGSKVTTSQPKLGELTMDEIFEPAPPPQKPLGEMTDEELNALDERGSAREALASS